MNNLTSDQMQYFKKSACFNFLKKPKKQKTPCFFDWEKKDHKIDTAVPLSFGLDC